MIYTGLLSLLLAEYAANQKCSAVLLCSADSIYPIIQRNRAKTKTQCMYLPSFLMGMMNAVTYNQLLCTKDIKTLNKNHFLPKCKQLQVRKQPQDGAKGYKANRVCVVYGRRHTCRPPMLRWASSRETHIVPSHTSSATRQPTQLNSTENYGRRCLTPLSPHRNYILS